LIIFDGKTVQNRLESFFNRLGNCNGKRGKKTDSASELVFLNLLPIYSSSIVLEFNDKQIRILQVAEKLFAENGFDVTSIRHIAQIADINLAMVLYYFGSKEKLLESLIYYRTQDLKILPEKRSYEPLTPI
jgi:hypothetical protein